MKLLEQISLWCHDGKHDKVYEIDLCEVGTNLHVVNFRYGRRGAVLKSGTKTAAGVSLDEARKILNALIAEKQKGGYQKTSHFVHQNSAVPAVSSISFSNIKNTKSKSEYVLDCLRDALSPTPTKLSERWSLTRIIWRVGELRIQDAAALLLPLIAKGDAMQHYCVCWALGRCGDAVAIPTLEQVLAAAASSEKVKRMALMALLQLEKDESKRKLLINNVLKALPLPTRTELQEGNAVGLRAVLLNEILEKKAYEHLESLYLLCQDFPHAHTVVLDFLHDVKIEPNGFRHLRHIYKLAEFRDDATVFAILTKKMESASAFFRFNRYSKEYGIYVQNLSNYFQNPLIEIKKEDSQLAFSEATKAYLGRRAWRTMKTLGSDNDSAYVHFAASLLLNYSDKDRTEARNISKTNYHWNSETRNYDYTTTSKDHDIFSKYLIFNHILYGNSPRYFLKKNAKEWQCKENYKPGQAAPTEREEAFSALWDKNPSVLINLVTKSNCEPVQNFAVKALKSRTDLAEWIDLPILLQVLAKPYASTTALGLEFARQLYDPTKPNLELILALANHLLQEARDLAKEWILEQKAFFIKETLIFADLIMLPHQDVLEWIRPILSEYASDEKIAKTLISKTLLNILALKNTETDRRKAESTVQILSNHFMNHLSYIELGVPEELLKHDNPNVQTLGALILLHHKIPASDLPQGIIAQLIQSPTVQVRQVGVRLFGRLPEEILLKSYEIIAAFCVSPHSEIRVAVQDMVKNLSEKNQDFGEKLTNELLPYFQRKETHEGLHADLYELFTLSLKNNLQNIENETVLSLIHGGRAVPERLGLFVLNLFSEKNQLSVKQIIRLASHEMLDIRIYAQQVFEKNVMRMRNESIDALKLLDSKWDDTRAFAMEYFRKYFNENHWTPELIVSVCDSTKNDIQKFGKELIVKYFRKEDGERYLMQLSQHPSQTVQNFTTFYLEEFATDKSENIKHLEPYFITVLSQVNKSGVAKKRIFSFLKNEALKNEDIATMVAKIMARQSVTMAVADKASCIAIMRDMKVRFPNIELPLAVA